MTTINQMTIVGGGDVPMSFPTIVVDPPWRYGNTATRGAAGKHYPTMSLDELADLDLPSAPDAHLYLWVTNGFLREGFDLMGSWGFTYKTILTWCKPQIGLGNWFRNSTEHVLFGVKGKQPTLQNNVPTHFNAPRTRHSAKPESFYDLVESCSPGPWLEVFSTRERFGWYVWGSKGEHAGHT
jgi:N6-adenosine-specific RNA methylase IME4